MNRIFLIAIGIIIVSFFSCKSDSKTETIQGSTNDIPDTVSKEKIASYKNYLAPPDSNYTGDYFKKYPNGVIQIRGFFRLGKKTGKWMYFYSDGKLWSEAFFDNDLMEGESKVYYPTGKLYYEGFYKNNKPKGVWKFYDTVGVVTATKNYDSIPFNKKK